MQIHVSYIFATLDQARSTWRDYINLTKPRIIVLLLLTTLAAMLIAAETIPPVSIIIWTLVGGALAAGSAGVFNCYLDRDIDERMQRTRQRPLPSQRLTSKQALYFGAILGLSSCLILWLGVNLLAAALALLGLYWYVIVYTYWLKRRSTQNIVIGGAAGAIPPLVGWAAATGTLSPVAILLFAIIFYWTPPHFWALALLLRRDYAQAGLPMLPVVQGARATHIQIVIYSLVMVLLTLLLSFSGYMGLIYTAAAVILGSLFLYAACQLLRNPTTSATLRLYKYSLLYLALLFVMMVADRMILF